MAIGTPVAGTAASMVANSVHLNLTPTVPTTGMTAGDPVHLYLTVRLLAPGTDVPVTTPSNWTLIGDLIEIGADTTGLHVYHYVRAYAAGMANPNIVTTGGVFPSSATCQVFGYPGAAVPTAASLVLEGAPTNAATHATPSVALPEQGMAVPTWASRSGETWTPSGATARSVGTNPPGSGVAATQLLATDGPRAAGTLTYNATISAATSVAVKGLLALAPGAPTPVAAYTRTDVVEVDATSSVGTVTLVRASGDAVTITEPSAKVFRVVLPATRTEDVVLTLTATSGTTDVETITIPAASAPKARLVRVGGVYA